MLETSPTKTAADRQAGAEKGRTVVSTSGSTHRAGASLPAKQSARETGAAAAQVNNCSTTASHKVQEHAPPLHTAVLSTLIFGKQEAY